MGLVEDPAVRMWRQACNVLLAPTTEESYKVVQEYSAAENVWHSLTNCISHQADVWAKLLTAGVDDVIQPAAFKIAIVLRHTPPDVSIKILADLLKNHPQSQDLTAYVLALLTDDEADPVMIEVNGVATPSAAVPLRDLQLFGDCELAVLAAPAEVYARHSDLVRAEYAQMSERSYIELRVKILNQLCLIPQLYRTPEFAHLERAARDNIECELLAVQTEMIRRN